MVTDLISKAFLTASLRALLLNLPPAGVKINSFHMELGIMLEDITSDSGFKFTDVAVRVNTSQLLMYSSFMIRTTSLAADVECTLRPSSLTFVCVVYFLSITCVGSR